VRVAGRVCQSGRSFFRVSEGGRAARRAARELKKRGLPKGGITALLRGGTYQLTRTFVLTKADSGAEAAPVRYRAYKNEEVHLIGGVVIPPARFGPVTDKAVLARLDRAGAKQIRVADLARLGLKNLTSWPDKTRGGAGTMELFFNGRPMQVARWPNKGWARTAKIVDSGSRPRHADKTARGGTFTYPGGRPKRWNTAEGVWLSGYWCHDWYDETIRVKSIDTAKRTITLAAPHHYGLQGANRRYYAVNLLEELDAPGEWILDAKRGRLYFLPPAKLDGAVIHLSVMIEPLIEIKGASHVIIEGLTLEAVRGAAVVVSAGKGNRVQRCLVRNSGKTGITISGGTDNGVVGCEITQTGAGGIALGGGDRKTLTPAKNFATDNHVHHFSRLQRTYAPAVGLHGVGNRVAHNLIHHAPHVAVLFGGNENVMEFNQIHNVCQETGDVGVFYTGRDWTVRGNVIRHNLIHDVSGPGLYGAQGIYLDDCASGTIVRGNVLFKVQRAMLIGGGRDNIIEGNVIVGCRESIRFDARGVGWMKYHVKPGGIMQKRLAGIPYRKPPWSERYPQLLTLLGDEPGAPKGNTIRWNILQGSGGMHLDKRVRQSGTIADNPAVKAGEVVVDITKTGIRLRIAPDVLKKLPKFKPIPFDKIGPRGKRHRP